MTSTLSSGAALVVVDDGEDVVVVDGFDVGVASTTVVAGAAASPVGASEADVQAPATVAKRTNAAKVGKSCFTAVNRKADCRERDGPRWPGIRIDRSWCREKDREFNNLYSV